MGRLTTLGIGGCYDSCSWLLPKFKGTFTRRTIVSRRLNLEQIRCKSKKNYPKIKTNVHSSCQIRWISSEGHFCSLWPFGLLALHRHNHQQCFDNHRWVWAESFVHPRAATCLMLHPCWSACKDELAWIYIPLIMDLHLVGKRLGCVQGKYPCTVIRWLLLPCD